ncbi:transcriptional regulator [Kytococcus aerolatus]|uniref:Transcriptional regulator n=1 Tax=Kytococcus aerolatus TaxID=592308 RepID=A0A212T1M0_9MICO|nr:WYL domain-containing protein [Kytococcus aerolatus]SNC59953.1 transcriptional regulator [Kytococcus aerolatus]
MVTGRGHDPNLKTERLLNLLIALLHTRRPLTKAEIRRAMPEYAEGSTEAFDRTFERDKADLRALGVPITTAPVDAGFDDEEGYRVDPAEYALPELVVDADELRLLGVAARVWGQASLAGAARRALQKVSADAPEAVDDADPDAAVEEPGVGLQPVIRTPEQAFTPLREAITARRAVTFPYRRSGSEPTLRRVEPWSLLLRRGRWYVTGHDTDRDAPRIFRLDRITGPVRAHGRAGAVQVPADHDPSALLTAHDAPQTVELRLTLRPGGGGSLRRLADAIEPLPDPAQGEVLHLREADRSRVVGQVAEIAPEVLAIEPAEIREQVVDRWRAAAGTREED